MVNFAVPKPALRRWATYRKQMAVKTDSPMIDNIVFDLGGVVIDLKREMCIAALERLGMREAGELLDKYVQRGPFLELECGNITAAEFFDMVRPKCGGASDEKIQNAFNEFLRALPADRLDALLRLRKRKRVFALSNTNPVMFNSWIAKAFSQQGMRINDYFDGVVASFQEGFCKPDPRIFEVLVRRYGLDPARTLFLDDSADNCNAARRCGLLAEHITEGNTMLDVVRRLLGE